jgi:hypothetical protein
LFSVLRDGAFAGISSPVVDERLKGIVHKSILSAAISALWRRDYAYIVRVSRHRRGLPYMNTSGSLCDVDWDENKHADLYDKSYLEGETFVYGRRDEKWCDHNGVMHIMMRWDRIDDRPNGIDKLKDYGFSIQTVLQKSWECQMAYGIA